MKNERERVWKLCELHWNPLPAVHIRLGILSIEVLAVEGTQCLRR
jgi:hypothetical protein